MPSCARVVDTKSKRRVQSSALYPQSTGRYYNAQKLIRRQVIHPHSLVAATAQSPSLLLSVKFSFTHSPQALWIQINKESY